MNNWVWALLVCLGTDLFAIPFLMGKKRDDFWPYGQTAGVLLYAFLLLKAVQVL